MIDRLRRILYRGLQLAVLALLVYGLAQTLPFDLAAIFAGDMLVYLEVVSAVWVAAQVTRFRAAFLYARAAVGNPRRGLRRLRRRVSRLARRLGRPGADEEGPRGALVPA